MFYCCGTLLVFLSVRDRVYNTQNADNSSQSNTYKTFLPLAFVRSGYVYLSYGYVSNVGEYGRAWSRTPKSSTHAYYLGMHPTYVNPSDYYIRYGGFPLRCLYPGSA